MNSETNSENIKNETARNTNVLPGVSPPEQKDDVISAAPLGTDADKLKKEQTDLLNKSKPKAFDITDFSGVNNLRSNLVYVKDLQDIADAVLYGVEAPRVDNQFKVINHVLDSTNQRPAIGLAYEILPYKNFGNINAQNQIAAAKVNMSDPSFNTPLDFYFDKAQEYLRIKRVSSFSTTFLTNLSLLVSRWLGEGARDNRAAPENTAADIVNLLAYEIDTNVGLLDTFHVGRWLYGLYQGGAPAEARVHVINMKDYVAYRNTTQPTCLPADTSVLSLSDFRNDDNVLGKLCIFDDSPDYNTVIIDYDNSITPQQNNTYHGIPARSVAWHVVNQTDDDIGSILDNSLDKQTIQFSLFLNLYHLTGPTLAIDTDTQWRMWLHKVPSAEAIVRLFARKDREKLRYLRSPAQGGIPNYEIFYSFRLFKTMFCQESFKHYGVVLTLGRKLTMGEDNLKSSVYNATIPGWEIDDYLDENDDPYWDNADAEYAEVNVNRLICAPIWIPYEMFLANIHKPTTLVLDEPKYESGVLSNYVNLNFKFPRSYVCDVDQLHAPNDNYFNVVYEGLGTYYENGVRTPTKLKLNFGYNSWMSIPECLPVIGHGKHRVGITRSDLDRIKCRTNNAYVQNKLLTAASF